jgi:predicted O-methyltransferase YrrM
VEEITDRLSCLKRTGVPMELPEIQLGVQRQLATLTRIGEAINHNPPFPENATSDFRYFYLNSQYGFNDGITLHGMLRSLRPKRLVEVGSGYSSALILDTNERYLGNGVDCSFIEPYPERLNALLRNTDRSICHIYESKVQSVDSSVFLALEAGDILFIDSSHVVKFGSDLEYILREVLPLLARGVFIHFHDIFYPFEYPEAVIRLGHFWNECYLLRAFLANNNAYRIELFSDYIARFHPRELEAVSKLCLKNSGANLWISKFAPP